MTINEYGIKARRKYQKDRYHKLKEAGALPPDSYDKEKRREYNQKYYYERKEALKVAQDERWNRKGEEDES